MATNKIASVDALEFLEKVKDYTQFESVTIAPDGSVSVKFSGRELAPAEKKESKKPPKKTAIDSLSETPPPFEFGAKA